MNVVHISPTYFADSSLIGGGERYVTELAKCMARYTDTTLVSFSTQRMSQVLENLRIELYPARKFVKGNKLNPLSFSYLQQIFRADVVHLHHVHTLISDISCLVSVGIGKPAYVTDYGGGADFVLNHKLPILHLYKKSPVYSNFMRSHLPQVLQEKTVLIKGGIDIDKFCPGPNIQNDKKILYVGRILPHKGINYLIEAFRRLNRNDYQLRIIGRVYHQEFYTYLREISDGLSVKFIHDADDSQLLHEYRTATVNVLPSVHEDFYGNYTPIPELMGFTLLEAQACGTPVICTDAGAMSEFLINGKTGIVTQQNSSESIANALKQICELTKDEYNRWQDNCRSWVQDLSWEKVVQEHLELYKGSH